MESLYDGNDLSCGERSPTERLLFRREYLLKAIENNQVETVLAELEKGVDVNAIDKVSLHC